MIIERGKKENGFLVRARITPIPDYSTQRFDRGEERRKAEPFLGFLRTSAHARSLVGVAIAKMIVFGDLELVLHHDCFADDATAAHMLVLYSKARLFRSRKSELKDIMKLPIKLT